MVCVLVAQSYLTLCKPMDCSPPGCSVHGILQARIREWVAIPFSRRSSWPRDGTRVSCIAGRFFTVWATREALFSYGETHKCLVLLLTATQDSTSFRSSWHTQTLCFKQSVPWTFVFLFVSVPVPTVLFPECPPPDAAWPTSLQCSWIPWSCLWSLPSLILQNSDFSRYIPFQLVLSKRREGNKREEWSLHGGWNCSRFSLPTKLFSSLCCSSYHHTVLLWVIYLFGHWMTSASKVDTTSYLCFWVLAPRSMLWPLDGEWLQGGHIFPLFLCLSP